jgi:Type IV secretion system pilin
LLSFFANSKVACPNRPLQRALWAWDISGRVPRPLCPVRFPRSHPDATAICSKEAPLKRLRLLGLVVLLAGGGLLLVLPAPTLAAPGPPDLGTVLNNLRNWLVGLLAVAATLALTVGGVRYIAAMGDPGQIEKAKTAFKGAAIGYGLAVLAPVLVAILKQIVKV